MRNCAPPFRSLPFRAKESRYERSQDVEDACVALDETMMAEWVGASLGSWSPNGSWGTSIMLAACKLQPF